MLEMHILDESLRIWCVVADDLAQTQEIIYTVCKMLSLHRIHPSFALQDLLPTFSLDDHFSLWVLVVLPWMSLTRDELVICVMWAFFREPRPG
jgi:hypothetical protein